MSENDIERTKLTVARAFITEKHHDVARAILETMPDNKQAQSWLGKLQKKSAKATPAKPAKAGGVWLPVLMIVIGLFAGIVAGLLLATDVDKLSGSKDVDFNATIAVQNTTIAALAVMPTTATDEPTPEFTVTPEGYVPQVATQVPLDVATEEGENSGLDLELDSQAEETEIPEMAGPGDEGATPPPVPVYDEDAMVMVFDSELVGLQPLFDSISLPSGFYDVTVVTAGVFALDLSPVTGDCTNATIGMFNLLPGMAATGMTAAFGSQDCTVQISVRGADAPWILTFQQISLPDVTEDFQLTYNSEGSGLQAEIGPVVIPSGSYDVIVTTTGFITVNLQQVSGFCDVNIFGLFDLAAGEAEDGAKTDIRSEECVGLITVANATAPWTLEFTATRGPDPELE